jgi:bloom syndrome protein
LQDVVTALGLSDYVLLSQSFNRPNLRYTVIPKKRDFEAGIVLFIKEKYPEETGIIYCHSRAKTEEVAMRLRQQGLSAKHFHAGLADCDRRRIQQHWQDDACKIIVATIAFGLGVDKANGEYNRLQMLYYSLTFPQCALSYITVYPKVSMRMSISQDMGLADLGQVLPRDR